MLKVSIEHNCEGLLELHAKGHCNYASYGKDIVCAGVSSVIIGLVTALETKPCANVDLSNGYAYVVCKPTLLSYAYFKFVYETLKIIEAEYKDNIQVNCTVKFPDLSKMEEVL